MEKKYRFIVFKKGADSDNLLKKDIISVKNNLTKDKASDYMCDFMESGHYQVANCKIETME